MFVCTTAGNEVTFRFESINLEHQEFIGAYTVTGDPTEVPDIVGQYAIDNSIGIEECDAPPAPEPEKAKKRRKLFDVHSVRNKK